MRKSVILVSESTIDKNIIEKVFPMFKPKSNIEYTDKDSCKADGHFIVKMTAKASMIRFYAESLGKKDMDEYADHVRDIREAVREFDSVGVVIDSEFCPPPMISWLFTHWNDKDEHEGIPVYIHWNGTLHPVSCLDMDEDAE